MSGWSDVKIVEKYVYVFLNVHIVHLNLYYIESRREQGTPDPGREIVVASQQKLRIGEAEKDHSKSLFDLLYYVYILWCFNTVDLGFMNSTRL